MTTTSPQFRMADRLAGGRLAATLRRLRSDGLSYEAIGRRLYAEHGIEASRQTVARWGAELGLDNDRGAA